MEDDFDNEAVVRQLDRLKESFLWAAAKGGRQEEVASLLEMGADIDWVSPEGDTPLLAACKNGHRNVATLLMVHGARVNARSTVLQSLAVGGALRSSLARTVTDSLGCLRLLGWRPPLRMISSGLWRAGMSASGVCGGP